MIPIKAYNDTNIEMMIVTTVTSLVCRTMTRILPGSNFFCERAAVRSAFRQRSRLSNFHGLRVFLFPIIGQGDAKLVRLEFVQAGRFDKAKG